MPVHAYSFDPDDPKFASILDELSLWSAPFGLKLLEENGMYDEIRKLEKHIHEKRMSFAKVKSLLAESGFVINRVIEDSFSCRYIDGTTMLEHFFIRLAFFETWQNLLPENKKAFIFETLELS